MAKVACEAVATFEFYSPIQLRFPKVLVRQGELIEIYEISDKPELIKRIQYKEANSVYDYLWVGLERYVTLVKDHPIVMRSALNAKRLAKYPVYNHLCEIKCPYAASIYNEEVMLVALGNVIYEFDLETCAMSKFIIKNQRFRPRTVTNAIACSENLVILGSYNKEIYLIDRFSHKLIASLKGQQGGVTQCLLKDFNLYTGGRKDSKILLWDLRNQIAPMITYEYSRSHPTNQKILFDVDSDSNVFVGNFDGSVAKLNRVGETVFHSDLHFDAVNSVQAFEGGFVSSSGQRHYEDELVSLIRVVYE